MREKKNELDRLDHWRRHHRVIGYHRGSRHPEETSGRGALVLRVPVRERMRPGRRMSEENGIAEAEVRKVDFAAFCHKFVRIPLY